MRLRRLELQEQKLDKLFGEVAKMDESEMKAHLAKYLCVQASGYLENVIKELVAEYHDSTCKKETESFINEKLKTFTNVDGKKIETLLTSFNTEWFRIFSSSVSEQQSQSLNNIISQRHLIAHGKESASNISFGYMVNYYNDLKDIVKVLRSIIKK